LDFIVEIAEFLSDNKNNGVSSSSAHVDLFWQFVDEMCSSSDTVDETVQLLTDTAAGKDDIDDSINKIKTLAYGIGTYELFPFISLRCNYLHSVVFIFQTKPLL
jgi:hypothetical protein